MSIKFINKAAAFAFFFLLLFSASGVYAQTAKFNRERAFDVQHYVIRTSFDRKNKMVFGDTTVSLKPLTDDFRIFELDAAGMDFEFVTLEPEQKPVSYRQKGEKVVITLDEAFSRNDLISVRFKYKAQPKKGVYFVSEVIKNGAIERDSQIWTQGEPEEAHHWFPSYDFPDDKATSEQFITVNKGETAIANGELVEQKDNPDGTTTFHYRMPLPYATYLTSFVIGKYVKVSDSYKNIPLGYYVYPGTESIVPVAYGKTKEMLRVFEELTGIDYPFNKYDQTMVANFNFGGMENITATTMADTEILFARYNRGAVEDLVAHEIAHSWFGNLVTCRNWAELWLNEGFATFLEAVFREKTGGRAEYIAKIRDDAEQFLADDAVNKKRHGLFNQLARPDDSIFDTTTYQKGGVVLHMLRETIGDDVFWKAVNIYLNRHKFGNVETPDLQKAMEEASGTDLGWFFKQWIYGAGAPKLIVRQIYDPVSKKLSLTVAQTHKEALWVSPEFILPLEVEVHTENGVKSDTLSISKRKQVFEIEAGGKPFKILYDKNAKLPLVEVKTEALTTLRGR